MTDTAADLALFTFDNSYARLPERFYVRQPPHPAPAPRMVRLNRRLAQAMGLDADALDGPRGAAILSGAVTPPGAAPLAMAYAGHQFGGWSPQLGDGRAILLGEVVGPDGVRRDLHLKGAGRTPFSRGGDGKAALGPALREYIVSEAMAALGVPTSRSLAVVATGETVYRETPLPGAVLARVATSHVRVGTFQFFAARGDDAALKALADYVIARHYPGAAQAPAPCLALLDGVIARTAALVAQWMAIGFIHGVMNTDNVSIAGETIDYGPCAFMDDYHPDTVYSSIDATGRYAYGAQPRVAHWNLAQLASALLPLLGDDEAAGMAAAQGAVNRYPDLFEAAWLAAFRAKLGLARAREDDAALIGALLAAMAAARADFTLTFRALCAAGPDDGLRAPEIAAAAPDGWLDDWLGAWRRRLEHETRDPAARRAAMRAANPAFIPRNHRVEAALSAAYQGDLAPLDALTAVLADPYADQPGREAWAAPPRPEEVVHATFCGT
ncbi:MAG: YdiU family protein [Rhodobacterales bacterium]|nr:YdiU family protein [Rhodobacterales bacterium]